MKIKNALTPFPFNYNIPGRLLASLLRNLLRETSLAFNEHLARMQVSYLEGRSRYPVNMKQRVYNSTFSKQMFVWDHGGSG